MLEGKIIAITGAGKGIGNACVRLALSQGAQVVAVTRSDGDVDQLIQEFGRERFRGMCGDVRLRTDLEALLSLAISEFGAVTGLVNNAGIRQRKAFLELSRAEFDSVVDANLGSCFEAMQVFGAHMLAHGGGSIVNVASIVGPRGFAHLPGYAASKAGMIGLSKSVAVELAGAGIRVNLVAPGFVETSYAATFRENRRELYDWTIARTPMRRWGRAEEVAASICYLLSDASSYVTGSVHEVDGGWLAQ